jgi:hypothetical protein
MVAAVSELTWVGRDLLTAFILFSSQVENVLLQQNPYWQSNSSDHITCDLLAPDVEEGW